MKALAKRVSALAYRHQAWQVFSDFVEMGAIALSNAVDLNQRDAREARYLQIVKAYSPDEIKAFPEMLGELVLALEAEPRDILGETFGELELGNKWTGQFFTPQSVADMMGLMTLSGVAIPECGYITVGEPAVGAGSLVIGACKAFKSLGFDWQRQMHVTATDVDERAVHMAYLQLSLLHVPAIIVHGNSLTLEERGVWYTPAHVMGFWSAKLNRALAPTHNERKITIQPIPAKPVGQLVLEL